LEKQAKGLRVAEVQPTPNPNAMKFVIDRHIWQQPLSFFNAEAARSHPLAAKLFAIPGVSGLLLLGNFITVSKTPQATWASIKTQVRRILAED
jgi:hypothetical protein